MSAPGYYKNDGGALLYAAQKVSFPDGTALIAAEGTIASPVVQGWQWFDDEPAARTAFGLPDPVSTEPP